MKKSQTNQKNEKKATQKRKENRKEKIVERINKKQDLFGRNIQYKRMEIDNSFPEYISINKEKFKNWIL